jgi:hypothetical protein
VLPTAIIAISWGAHRAVVMFRDDEICGDDGTGPMFLILLTNYSYSFLSLRYWAAVQARTRRLRDKPTTVVFLTTPK